MYLSSFLFCACNWYPFPSSHASCYICTVTGRDIRYTFPITVRSRFLSPLSLSTGRSSEVRQPRQSRHEGVHVSHARPSPRTAHAVHRARRNDWVQHRRVVSWLLQLTVVWRAVDVTWQTATLSKHAGPCCDAERQQDQCQASAAVVTLAANPRALQAQSRHSDVQGSSDVITAVPKFTAERSHPVTDAPTFQHATPDRAENAHWTCKVSVLRRCTFSVEQSAGRCCWH